VTLASCVEIEEMNVLSYPRWLFKMVANIRESFKSCEIRFSFASIPTTQFLVNDREPGLYKTLVT
jgi:hypothetical protein